MAGGERALGKPEYGPAPRFRGPCGIFLRGARTERIMPVRKGGGWGTPSARLPVEIPGWRQSPRTRRENRVGGYGMRTKSGTIPSPASARNWMQSRLEGPDIASALTRGAGGRSWRRSGGRGIWGNLVQCFRRSMIPL
eukprot:2272103-Rhodomonas_salina.1